MFKRFFGEEEGATMVEYGLLVALIALAAILGVTALGQSLNDLFNSVSETLSQNT